MFKRPCSTLIKIYIYLFSVCGAGILAPVIAQKNSLKGLPFIINYRYQDYGADGINWWVEEDDHGVLYFANNQGVLIYDGQRWDLVKPPGASETRSLVKGADGKIYVGTNGDIGYLAPGRNGKLEFFSLKDKLPEDHRLFAEVWETQEFQGEVYFRTNNKMFIWDFQSFRILESQEGFHVGNEVNDQYYVRIWTRGLTVLKQDSFHLVPNGEKFANERIYVMLPYDDKRILIGARTQGMFIYDGKEFTPFKTEADPFIVNTSLYGGRVLSNGLIALNTFNDGMVIIDKQGKLIQRIDKSVGLQDNSVDQVFEDSRGILWMPLFNGIAKFDLRSSLTFYNEAMGLPAKTVFSVGAHHNQIYAGTNNGIYWLNPSINRFEKIPGSSGQAGNFIVNGRDLLVSGAEKGLIKLVGNKAIAVIPGINYDFHLRQVLKSRLDSTILYCALRSGLAVVRYTPSTGEYAVESFAPILNSSASLISEKPDGNLWMSGDDIGEVKLVKPNRNSGKWILHENEVTVYNARQGLPHKIIAVLEYDKEVYFAADRDSIFIFDEVQQRFIRDTGTILNKQFALNADYTLVGISDPVGRIWANFGQGVFAAIPSDDGSHGIINAPFKELRKNYPIWDIALSAGIKGEVIVWMSGREGIIRYDGNLDTTAQDQFSCILRGITLNEDSVYYTGFGLTSDGAEFSHGWNTVQFDFAAPFFKLENETRFSSILEGRDNHWSDWDKQNFREFGNLPAGLYTFRVKAKNIYDTESSVASFMFTVLPPWYSTWWAYLLYAILAGALIYAIVRWRTRQLHEKHRELEIMVNERTAELKLRVDELAVINSVQEGLASKLDLQAIYDLVGDKIRDVFDAQGVAISFLDRATHQINNPYYLFEGKRINQPAFEFGRGITSKVIRDGQALLINEKAADRFKEFGAVFASSETEATVKSWLGVPLISAGKANGVIKLENYNKEFAYSEGDVSLLQTLANSMSVALENARLFDETNRLLKETEQRTAELAVINSVQEGLARELDMQGIYDLVGERIRLLFDAQAVVIATLDLDQSSEHFKYAIENGERFYPNPRPYDKLRQRLVETKQKIVINTGEEAFRWFGQKVLPGTKTMKSGVFVPLVLGEKITSYISLQNVDKEYAFSDSDIRLLETLANSMSVALENARLFDETNRLLKETEQRTGELAVINSVQEGLARELDLQGIYNLIGDRVQQLFNAQAVIIASLDLETNTEHFNYVFENNEKVKIGSRPINKLRRLLIDRKQVIYIATEYQALHDYGLTAIEGTQMPKSLLFVPMLTGHTIKGYVSLQNIDLENAFSSSDIRLLETLANSMSVALENARLFDETNRLLKETEQRTAELAVINSVQDGLAKELDIRGIYNLVGDRLCELFPDSQTLVIRTFEHETGLEHWQYSKEKGVRQYVHPRPFNWNSKQLILSKKPLDIKENYIETAVSFGGTGVTAGQPPKSALFVPMIVGDLVKGSISLQNVDREFAFNESDLRLLTTLTNSMSVALENARLFDETNRLLKETEQRTAELAVINSVQEGLARELDMQGIYDLIGDRVQKLFNAQAVIIATLDLENQTEHFNYVFENNERVKLEPRPINKLRQLLVDKKHFIYIASEEQARNEYGVTAIAGTLMPKSLLFVPMLTGNIIKGYVSLQNMDIENAFSHSDIRLLETLANSMSVALENARLFDETNRLLKETEQRTAELAVINSVQEGLAKELDMRGIYDLVGDRLCELFPDTQTLVIRTFDHESGIEHFQYAIEKGNRLSVDSQPFIWASRHLIEDRKAIHINENYLETSKKFGGTGVTKGQPPKSAVFVPMLVGDLVKGSISLQNVDRENAFSDSDLRLLTTITNSMSVALENARLFDETNRLLKETEQRTAELAVINSVQDGLVREMDINAIYELVGKRLCDLFNTQTVLIRTFDHTHGLETWRYVIEKGERHYSEPRPLIWANKHLIQHLKPILINENYLETSKKYGGSGVSMGLPPKSAVFVPMIVGDIVKGSVSLQNVESENAFSESDLRLLTTITNSMSVALENARLFDETTHLLSESKQRAAELSTVNSISRALASQLDQDDLINLVGDQLKDLFKANIVYLALLNNKTNIIDFPYQYGEVMPSRKIGEGLTSKIIMTGEPLLINKDMEESTAQLGIQHIGLISASYLGVPIPVGDKIIGVLSVQSTEQENRFNENDLRLLSTIASSVGVALNNATLFEEVKMAKQEAETASLLAEKANEAKSAFLSTVSHELRTPLTSVLGFAKIIKKRLEERIFPATNTSDPRTEKAIQQVSDNLNVVVSEGQRLTSLINDVLDLAKIEAGKMQWSQENVSLEEVAERAIAATTSLFDQKSLVLVKDIEDQIPEVIGDKDKLIQVIVNLISNSVKFTPEGTVTCKIYRYEDEVRVSISDTGIGIAPKDHAAVFEQFKQVGDTLTDKPKGTGLGLPICKEIVEHHGGRIWLESELGKGSTFIFALPLKQTNLPRTVQLDDLVKQLKEQVAQSQLNVHGQAANILIVDDDDSIRSLLQQELGEAGYQIDEARNGKEALTKVREHRPDLILLDIMMPEMNGFDVAAVLKNDPQTMDIPIIVLSIVQDKARGFKIGVDRYLSKPIDTGILFNEIGSLLEQGKSKKKVMIVDEDSGTVNTLTEVLKTKGYLVMDSNGKELVENALAHQPDIIIINSVLSGNQEMVKALRFEKGMEDVLFLLYQ